MQDTMAGMNLIKFDGISHGSFFPFSRNLIEQLFYGKPENDCFCCKHSSLQMPSEVLPVFE